MKKMRFWAMLISAMLVFALLPASVFAEATQNKGVKPVSATFSGTVVNEGYVGQKKIYGEHLLGKKGNYIKVNMSDGSYRVYNFLDNAKAYGFYLEGVAKDDNAIWPEAYVKGGLKKGKNKVTFTVYCPYTDEAGEENWSPVRFKTNVTAKRLYVDIQVSNPTYNGKVRKPKITVKDGNGKKIAESKYKISYVNKKGKLVKKPWGKAINSYEVIVEMKDKKKYMDSNGASYDIRPKGTSIESLKAGKNTITVKWKEQTKNTSGYRFEIYKNNKFNDNNMVACETIYNNKTTSKKSGCWFESNRTYYVRVCTVTRLKDGGEVYSGWSEVKSVKVK